MGQRLAGEVAIITGSTSGLGKVAAGMFAEEGAQVVVTGRNAERGQAVVDAITDKGGQAMFVAVDLLSEDSCRDLVAKTVERFGAVTVLINNAVDPEVIAADNDAVKVDKATVERMLQVNVVGPVLLSKYAIPEMIKAGHGSIVMVSATSAAVGTPGKTAYSASKGAMTSLTKAIVSDFGRQGVRCNTLQAGYIIHERRHAGATEEREKELLAKQVTRLATPEDVSYALLFLASRESDCITGVTLPVDSGATAVRALTF
jgi:NAD(P)-dependent dehydrogenase (short-subunit alcohol dehydrogenase family)